MKPTAKIENIVVQKTAKETLVYDLALNKAFLLNETSAFVWNLCDGTNSVSQISQLLAKHYKQPVNEEIVWLAIESLQKENLIANGEDLPDKFAGMPRREVIKRIGLGSLIALPLISSIVAPKAANAASVSPCTSNVCFAPGSNVCAGCENRLISITQFSSTNGSCSGTNLGTNNGVPCGSGVRTATNDVRRN